MSEVTISLTKNVARAILGDIVEDATKGAYASNKGWSWWAYDSSEVSYPFGSGAVKVVQRPVGAGEWSDKVEGDTEIVFEFMLDNGEAPRYFRVLGEYTSYNGDTWNEGTFKEVRPTKVVRRLYEPVK